MASTRLSFYSECIEFQLTMYSLFDSFFYPPARPPVVVISDSEYKEYQRARAEKEVLVLESKLNRYQTAIDEVKVQIEQLQKNYALLPEPKEEAAAA